MEKKKKTKQRTQWKNEFQFQGLVARQTAPMRNSRTRVRIHMRYQHAAARELYHFNFVRLFSANTRSGSDMQEERKGNVSAVLCMVAIVDFVQMTRQRMKITWYALLRPKTFLSFLFWTSKIPELKTKSILNNFVHSSAYEAYWR